MKWNLGQDLVKILKLKFYGEADVWLKLKLMLGRKGWGRSAKLENIVGFGGNLAQLFRGIS